MKTLTTISLALAVAAAGAQTTSQSQIRHIETSLNHLTVLEFGESVTTLAIADPDSFQVERHDDKVFVKPLREGVSTNLFVWTASRELSYELDPAGQLAAMDVLVRTEPAPNPHVSAQASAEPSDAEIRKIASLVLTQAMMGVEDIAHDAKSAPTDRVRSNLNRSIARRTSSIFAIRSPIETKAPFRVTTPGCMRPASDRAAHLARESQESPDHFPDLRGLQSATGLWHSSDAGRIRHARSCAGGEDNRRHQHWKFDGQSAADLSVELRRRPERTSEGRGGSLVMDAQGYISAEEVRQALRQIYSQRCRVQSAKCPP